MAIANVFPQFTQPGEELAKGVSDYAALRQKMNEANQENQYRMGTLDIAKQKLPFEIDELKAKIRGEDALADWRKKGGGLGVGGLGAGGREEMLFQSLVGKDNPQLKTPEQIYEASNVLRSGGNQLSDGTPLNSLSPASMDSFNRLTKYGNTNQGLNQQRFAATVDALIDKAEPNAKSAVKYSGLIGKGRGTVEKAASLLGGEGSPDYQNYLNFTRVDVPSIASEFMRQMGVNASDEQKRLYLQVVNPVEWDTNPTQAYKRWQHFIELSKTATKAISSTPGQLKMNTAKEGNQSTKVDKNWVIKDGKLVEG